ncbi:MAG: flagellar biosynthetic protein FliO [Nevskia sp.]|nr:flagellar biosynthetic protein FliO [Nevskia sp.]
MSGAGAVPVASGVAQTALSLLLVLGAIFALAWLLRRVQAVRPGQGGVLSVRGGLQVGARERVLWIRAGETDLLIGVAAGRVQTLHVFDRPPAGSETPAEVTPPNFAEALRKLMRGGKP